MNNIDKLYRIDNKCVNKTINIEISLYEKLKKVVSKKYDATISDMINVILEDYLEKNKPTFYGKKEDVIYRSIRMRKKNLEGLKKMSSQTGISVTRLVNGAIKEYLENL